MIKSFLGRKDLFALDIVHHPGKSGRNSRVWKQKLKQKPWRNFTYQLAPHGPPRTHHLRGGIIASGLGHAILIINQDNLMEAFSLLSLDKSGVLISLGALEEQNLKKE